MKKAASQGTIRVCKEFAATDFKFLSIAYIQNVEKKGCVLDPSEYLFVKDAIEQDVSKTNVHYLRNKKVPKYQTLITDH